MIRSKAVTKNEVMWQRSRVIIGPLINRAAAPLLLLVCSAALAREALAAGNVLEEFRFDAYNAVVVVPVRFRDREYRFVLDTGSPHTIVEPDLMPMLVKGPGMALFVGMDETNVLPLYHAGGLALGAITLPALDAVTCVRERVSRLLPEKVDGYLGMDALHGFIVQIDFDAGKIFFLRSVPCDAGLRLAMEPRKSDYCPVIKASIGRTKSDFLVDTGAIFYGAGSLAKRDFERLVENEALHVIECSSRGAGAPDRAAVMAQPFFVGPHQHVGLVFHQIVNPQWRSGVLGVGYLRRYKVTFDFPGRAVYLAPGAQSAMIDAKYDPGGLRFRREADGVRVYGIASPAVDAGVRAKDTLERVNGEAVAGLDNVRLAQLLSNTDVPTSFIFRRAADRRALAFTYDWEAARSRAMERLNAESGERHERPQQR